VTTPARVQAWDLVTVDRLGRGDADREVGATAADRAAPVVVRAARRLGVAEPANPGSAKARPPATPRGAVTLEAVRPNPIGHGLTTSVPRPTEASPPTTLVPKLEKKRV
jgi:hypothetical protein